MAPIWNLFRAKASQAMTELYFADLTIVLSEQTHRNFYSLRHWTRLSACFIGSGSRQEAQIKIVARGPTKSYCEWRAEPTVDEAREVFALLHQAGCPERPARLEGVLDTAIGGFSLEVTVHENGQPWHSEVSLQGRGFEGPDAGPLREACLRTFTLSGWDEFEASVFGPPRPFAD